MITSAPAIAPMARLAFRRAERDRQNSLLVIAAIALPIAFGSLIVPVAIGPDPLALIFVVMVAAVIALSVGAVLAVSTRRQLLRFGRLSAIGAEPAQIRWLLAFESLPPAGIGHVLGTVVGTVASITVGPLRWVLDEEAVGSGSVGRTGTVALLVAIGQVPLLAATVMGLWFATGPAAKMAMQSPTEALAAAGPEPEPRRLQGLVGLGLGAAAIAYCLAAEFSPGGLTLAVIAVLVGVHLLIAPILIRLDGLAAHLPRSIRLATRNGVRSRTRFGRLTMASIGTIALGVMAAAGVLSDSPGTASSGRGWGLDDRFVLVPAALLGTETEERVRQIIDVEAEAELQLLDSRLGQIWHRSDDGYSSSGISTAVLTSELAEALGADSDTMAAAERGAIILPDGSTRSLAVFDGDGPGPDLEHHTTRLGLGHSVATDQRRPTRVIGDIALMSADRAAELDASARWADRYLLLVADGPLSDDQRSQLSSGPSGSVLISDPNHNLSTGPTFYWIVVALAASFLIAFGLIGAALSGAETEDELRAMIANGADPSIRRWFRANQSALQLLLAGAIGAPLGVLLFWAVTRTDSSVPDAIVPWEAIAVLSLGVPLAVYALVLAFTGAGTAAVSRRGLA